MKRLILAFGTIASSFVIGVNGAIAATFSIQNIASRIAQKTNVPVLLPPESIVEKYKFNINETIYAYAATASEYSEYVVIFSNKPDNVSGEARQFFILAKKGRDIDENPTKTMKRVRLADSSQALVTEHCIAEDCWSTVQWKTNNVLYQVSRKSIDSEAAIAIANSAIQAGDRSRKPVKIADSDVKKDDRPLTSDQLQKLKSLGVPIVLPSNIPQGFTVSSSDIKIFQSSLASHYEITYRNKENAWGACQFGDE